jgi:hypothetical protein
MFHDDDNGDDDYDDGDGDTQLCQTYSDTKKIGR